MVDRWIHIQDSGGDWWIQPIWSEINKSVERKKVAQPNDEMRSLGLHLSTRLDMLPRINKRVNEDVKELYTVMKKHETKHITTLQKRGVGYQIDNELKYQLLIDIDSLLFETNSCTELMQKFLVKVYQHLDLTIGSNNIGWEIRKLLTKKGQNVSWFVDLDVNRNFFTHEGSPYLAVDITDPINYDLLSTVV